LIPILSASEMRDQDALAVAARGVDALVRAAGTAVGFEAKRMLGACYGARVAVLVGPGLNGGDGRIAATWLRSRGAHVDLVEVARQPTILRGYDLVVDAAFGLGCSRPYVAPEVDSGTLVLAVDLPSGVDSDTGELLGRPLVADRTLAIGALKLAHVTGECSQIIGELRFAGLGIVQSFESGLVEDSDLEQLLVMHEHDHKWSHAITVFAGSTLMPGAAELVVRGALAAGASMIRLSSRGEVSGLVDLPPEVVHTSEVHVDKRCRSVVAGPGLGSGAAPWLQERLTSLKVPVVLDADGLDRGLIAKAPTDGARWILTPHDGEFARLTGELVPANRIGAAGALARETGCVVLLKGPITVVADPSGSFRIVNSGTSALATAGSGDVLAGLIGGALARGLDTMNAGALCAHLHGRAGATLSSYARASQLPGAVSALLEDLLPVG
jgi:hydroxyethylthiazole kinase-like uncharacterized protein yjeF